MRVLVDTTVWSLALRRRPDRLGVRESRIRQELADLITDDRVVLIGAIRQEVLSGVRDPVVFERLRGHLRPFEDELLVTEDYEAAARAHNACRAAGISGSAVDFLVCAVAERRKLAIFTTDRDFEGYSRVLPIRLHGLATVGERARGTPA